VALPAHWVLREYRPDYGIDFAAEVFAAAGGTTKGAPDFETLGEHFFIQLKGCTRAKPRRLRLYSRYNVEKARPQKDKKDPVGELDVVPFSLEVSGLVTVQRMGAALPVLLVLANLETQRCHFVCINDHIDKILVPYSE